MMLREEWDGLFDSLRRTRDIVTGWEVQAPDMAAVRCEQSRHRTLAHLRACQEQWAAVVREFSSRDNPSVTILHPWLKFDQARYGTASWQENLAAFLDGREEWLDWQDGTYPERGGKMNRKPETIGSLTGRLANHEAYHVGMFGA